MKKNLLILLLILSLSMFGQSNFSNGYSDGYKNGYCQNQGIGCMSLLPPIAPIPNVGENLNSYQDGYNRGFANGLNSQKSINSNLDRQRYQTSEAKYVENKMYSTNINDAVAVAKMLYNFKDEVVELGDTNPERQIQLCKAGLSINPKDVEFLSLIGRIYARHYNDDKTALLYLENAYRYDKNGETGVQNLINAIKNGTIERVENSIKEEPIQEKLSTYTKNESVEIICKLKAILRDQPNAIGNTIAEIPERTIIYTLGKENNYWKINYDGKIGFANEMYFEKYIATPVSSATTNVENNLKLGNSSFSAKDYPNAIKYFSLVLEEKEIPNIYFLRAISKSELNDRYGVISDLDKLIKLGESKGNYDMATVYNNKAYALVGLKNYKEALPLVQKALSLNSNLWYIWDTSGEIKYNLNLYSECITDMKKAIILKPNKNSYYFCGLAKIKMKKITDACKDFSKAGELGKSEAYQEINKYCK